MGLRWVIAVFLAFGWAAPTPSPDATNCAAYRQVNWNAVRATRELVAKAASLELKAEDVPQLLAQMKARDLALVQIPEEAIPTIEAEGKGRRRYGHSAKSMHWTELGEMGGPGGVLIRAEPETADAFDPMKFHVPPHTHPDSHVSVVLEGEGYFFTFGKEGATYVPVRKGSVVAIPAGVPHTFWAGKGGISVLALTDKLTDPESPGFAKKYPIDPKLAFTPLKESSRAQ